jgi:glycosyltransferase involved in cell wall biosynthesis
VLERELPEWTRDHDYDVVWYDREKMWQTAGGLVAGQAVVDVDDVEDVVLRRWLDLGLDPDGGPLTPDRKGELETRVAELRARHDEVAAGADALLFSSRLDHERFAFPHAHVVPNTYEPEPDVDGEPAAELPAGEAVLFQGWLEWGANEDAALWFAHEVLPTLRALRPEALFVLVGAPSSAVAALAGEPGVHVVGEVPRMAPYLAAARVMVAPLRVGGGTRIKILEGFAHGVPVVSTRVGCEGLEVEPGTHLEVADEPGEFAVRVADLLRDAERRRALADRAAELYRARYCQDVADEAIRAVIEHLSVPAGAATERP